MQHEKRQCSTRGLLESFFSIIVLLYFISKNDCYFYSLIFRDESIFGKANDYRT